MCTETELNNHLNSIDENEKNIKNERDLFEFSDKIKLAIGWVYNLTLLHTLLESACDLHEYKVSITVGNNVVKIFLQGFLEYEWLDIEDSPSKEYIFESYCNQKDDKINDVISEWEDSIEKIIV